MKTLELAAHIRCLTRALRLAHLQVQIARIACLATGRDAAAAERLRAATTRRRLYSLVLRDAVGMA